MVTKTKKAKTPDIIVEFAKRGGLAEIYSQGLELSLLVNEKTKLVGIHPPVRCKDFLSDAYWSENVKKDVSIFGFKWKPGQKSLFDETQFMGLYYEGKDLKGMEQSLENFMNQWEKMLDIPLSKAYLDNTGKHIVVEFSREWTTQPIRVSLFTLLLRIGIGYDGSDLRTFMERVRDKGNVWGRNDGNYTKTAWPKFETLFKEQKIPWKQKFTDYTDVGTVHGSSGIVNYNGK